MGCIRTDYTYRTRGGVVVGKAVQMVMNVSLSLRSEEFPAKVSEYLPVNDCFFLIMSSPTSATPDFFPL